MIRLFLLILILATTPAMAQPIPDPMVEVELDQTRIIPGQSAKLRITVLVPTWMPKPVEFPGFEAPNLRVRLPERATTSISRRIDGQNWSGVMRDYMISPMVPGVIVVPSQDIGITYAGPDSAPVTVTVQTDEITIAGVIPKEAEGLTPFVAANDLVLTQELSGPTTDLSAGASVTRTVTARMVGASPIVLPPLIPPLKIDGIRIYDATPQVTEHDDRDGLSGERTETETLMAVGGGSGTVPPISIRWFDLDTATIKTSDIKGFDISVNGPPARSERPAAPPDWRVVAGGFLGAMLVLVALWRGLPRLTRWLWQRQQAYLLTEAHARSVLLHTIRQQSYGEMLAALDGWQRRAPDLSRTHRKGIDQLVLRLGNGRFGKATTHEDAGDWALLAQAVRHASSAGRAEPPGGLPPLNG